MRQFTHLNNQWAVRFSGINSGSSSGKPPTIMTSFGVIFSCISDPRQSPYSGSVSHDNLDNIPDNILRQSLDKAIAKLKRSSE